MGYDPSEPRDKYGQWTDSSGRVTLGFSKGKNPGEFVGHGAGGSATSRDADRLAEAAKIARTKDQKISVSTIAAQISYHATGSLRSRIEQISRDVVKGAHGKHRPDG